MHYNEDLLNFCNSYFEIIKSKPNCNIGSFLLFDATEEECKLHFFGIIKIFLALESHDTNLNTMTKFSTKYMELVNKNSFLNCTSIKMKVYFFLYQISISYYIDTNSDKNTIESVSVYQKFFKTFFDLIIEMQSHGSNYRPFKDAIQNIDIIRDFNFTEKDFLTHFTHDKVNIIFSVIKSSAKPMQKTITEDVEFITQEFNFIYDDSTYQTYNSTLEDNTLLY